MNQRMSRSEEPRRVFKQAIRPSSLDLTPRDPMYTGSVKVPWASLYPDPILFRTPSWYDSACRRSPAVYNAARHTIARHVHVSDLTIIDGRYHLKERIGRGGVGEVWRAVQQPLGRKVALKVLRHEYAKNAQIRRRFAREARAASGLAHPNIAAVYDFGSDALERLFIAMELIEGPSVSEAIETGLSVRNLLELADQLLAGLAHAHARGVVHRDLKPDNVVLSGARLPDSIGIPKIVDFGIATVADRATSGEVINVDDSFEDDEDRSTLRGEVIGTPRYMSPEQAIGERNLSQRTDLYNVGLILYEIVTGHPPFGETKGLAVMSRHVHDPIPDMVGRDSFVLPEEIEACILRSLEKRPLDRWASAAEMRRALRPFLDAARESPEANVAPAPIREAQERPSDTSADDEIMVVQESEIEYVEPWQQHQRIPFVGRDRERTRLTDLVSRVLETGRGSIVLLSGEAGVGKSRLAEWLKEYVEEQGFMRANSGAFARGGNASLRGIQDVVESMFRTRGLPREEVAEKIAQRMEKWGHPSPGDAEALTDFVRPTSLDETRPASVSTSALFATITRVLEVGAQQKPRLIFLDDIHWAGRELADFLDYLAVELRHRSIPVIVLATIRTEDLVERPELETKLGSLSRYTGETVERMTLDRFGANTGKRLIQAVLPTGDELSQIVLSRTSGNPLHMSFLLRYLRDEGLLEKRNGLWHAASLEDVQNAVPPSLGDLFRVRIEQTEAHYKIKGRLWKHLELAAIVGPRFQYDVVRRMAEYEFDPGDLQFFDYDLDRLVSEGFLTEIEGRGDDWYGFSHGLLRDYLLERIGPVASRQMHRDAARSLEEVFGQQAEGYAHDIARHWYAARDYDRALHWYQQAAMVSLRSFVLPQAAHAWQNALEIMDDKLGLEESEQADPLMPSLDRTRFDSAGVVVADYLETLSRLGDLYEGFGDFARAESVYRRVVRIVGRDTQNIEDDALMPLGYSWLGLGHVAWQRGDFEAAEWAFKKVEGLVTGRSDQRKLHVRARLGLARVEWHRASYTVASTMATDALRTARSIGDHESEAEAQWLLGEISRMGGNASEAREFYIQSLEVYRDANVQTGITRNLLSLAQLARLQKDFDDAKDLYLRALAHYEHLGDRRGAGNCQNGLGDIARLQLRYADANAYYGRALEIYEAIGAEYDLAVVLANLGLNAMGLADFEAADSYLDTAYGIVSAGDFPYILAGIEYNKALLKAIQGDETGMADVMQRVMRRSEATEIADIDYARPLEELGRIRAEAGARDEALKVWERALQIYVDLGLTDDAERVEVRLDSLGSTESS